MKEVRLEDDPEFVRDIDSKAVLNSNVGAYQLYKARRSKQKKGETLEQEMSDLKQEVQELKQLLLEIAQRVR